MVKNKKIKRFMAGLLTCMLCIPMFSANLVYAEELPDEDTAIAENYWGDLEKDDSIVGGIYPKNLMKPQESVLKNVTLSKAWDSPSTGVYKNANTLTYTMGMDMFDYISKPELKDNEGDNGDPEYQDGKYHNPFHFSFDKDFIKDRDQLNVYGDISVNGNTEHDSVATHKVGDKLNVDFSVDLSNFGKFQNSRIWQNMNGYSAGMAWKHHGVDGAVSTDAEVVFSIKMPQGITVPDDANVTIEGLSNFSISKETVDGKLLIKLRKIQEKQGYMTAKNYYELINKIAEVKIHIKGIAVGENAPLNQPLAISGSVVGVHDEYITDNVDKAKNKSSDGSDCDVRAFYFFVAKQSKAGRDAAAPQDKPNLISYTFKVKKPAQSTVTFKDGDKTHATVKVETGKAIDTDALTDQSMPKDPTKVGYTFKEWNTKEDGKGYKFTGASVVDGDMTVYAIYTKDYVPTPTPTPTQNTVTFINGDEEYAKVKVENGKSISGDALYTESMPKDPTKAGYVFKEWNTSADGKGTAFTGDTIVDKDMKVYAIYDKKVVKPDPKDPVKPDPKKPAKPDPKKPVKPEPKKPVKPEPQKPVVKVKVPQTGDSSNIVIFTGLLGLSGGALAVLIALRKRKMREEN